MSELKPCPFCGGEAQIDSTELHDEYRADDFTWLVICSSAACYGNAYQLDHTFYNRQDAVEAWNTRTPPPPNDALLPGTQYILVTDMEECNHHAFGKGMFASVDCIKTVEGEAGDGSGQLWKAASANDSMRHMEASDVAGGLTDSVSPESGRLKEANALISAVAIHLESNWRAIDGYFLFKLLEFLGKPADYAIGGKPLEALRPAATNAPAAAEAKDDRPHCPSCTCECQCLRQKRNDEGYLQCIDCGGVDWSTHESTPTK